MLRVSGQSDYGWHWTIHKSTLPSIALSDHDGVPLPTTKASQTFSAVEHSRVAQKQLYFVTKHHAYFGQLDFDIGCKWMV